MNIAATTANKQNQSKAAANNVSQQKNSSRGDSDFVDNRPETKTLQSLQMMINGSPRMAVQRQRAVNIIGGSHQMPIQLKGAIEIFTEAANIYGLSLAEMDLVLTYGKEGIATQLAAVQYDLDNDWNAFEENVSKYKKMSSDSLLPLAVKFIKTGNCGQTARSLYGALMKGNPDDIEVGAMKGKQEGYDNLIEALSENKDMIFKIDVGKSHTFFISKEEDGSIQLMQAWQGMYTLADWLRASSEKQTRYTLEEFIDKILGVAMGKATAEKSLFKPEKIDVKPKIEEREKLVFIAGVIDTESQENNLHKAMQERFKEFQ